ncbi:MAG: hypothetical protein AUJ21_11855 [Anaerolineae bacterium CG1_02_58_13]|nr:MAG: hypothetical protein AUJ21_11855 [Anaerolineae bacterium CG1_02_58_13]
MLSLCLLWLIQAHKSAKSKAGNLVQDFCQHESQICHDQCKNVPGSHWLDQLEHEQKSKYRQPQRFDLVQCNKLLVLDTYPQNRFCLDKTADLLQLYCMLKKADFVP